MSVRKTYLFACILAFAFTSSVVAQTLITGQKADYELAPGPVVGSTTAVTARAGATNAASSPGFRNCVYIFALPPVPAGQVVTSATLALTYVSKSGASTFNTDLWGIGFQAGTTPVLNALAANTASEGVKLQDNIIEPTTATGRVTSTNFISYLQDFYAANPAYAGGTNVFLRLNPDVGSTSIIGYNLATADGAAADAPVLRMQFGAPLADVHPRLMAGPPDRPRIIENIRTVPWFATAYQAIYNGVAADVNRHRTDPNYILSRMQMNWVNRYTVDTVNSSNRWQSGSHGAAGVPPVPTPRFAGARDWATDYSLDSGSSALPYNDDPAGTGKIWMKNKTTGVYAWTDPGLTGQAIEKANADLMAKARDAAFVYWLTGDEAFAKFATDIFWQFWYGYSFKQTIPTGAASICGTVTFEVIHDEMNRASAITYDFLHPYLVAQGKDTVLIEAQFRRVANRQIDGGNPTGNWNIIQAIYITHLGLVLQPNSAYPDGKGREYYADVVLNAALPKQTGLTQVIQTGYDQTTALWPEAWGYGIDVTSNLTDILSLLDRSGFGTGLLASGIFPRAVMVQNQMLYPHGWAANCGDTGSRTVETEPMELLAAAAQRRGDTATLAQMVGALRTAEGLSSPYNRTNNRGLVPLCFYSGELPEIPPTPPVQSRHFHAAPLNQWIMRTPTADYRYSLGSSLAGTAGGHAQNQGLALELYGAGMTIGPDPSRGSSYWQPDYHDYIKKPPSHNTVIVGGLSTAGGAFTTRAVEPATTAAAVSPNFNFVYADLSNTSPSSVSADQRRLVANVLTGSQSGFYFDVFRSKLKSTTATTQSHDYLYHSIGLSATVSAVSGTSPILASSGVLTSANGNQKGYDYFKDEKSAAFSGDFKTEFDVNTGNAATAAKMTMWMLGQPNRTIFSVNGQTAVLPGSFPSTFNNRVMPTILIRQNNNAWTNPFISVFEPSLNSAGPKVTAVRALDGFSTGNTIMVAVNSELGNPALADTTYLFSDDNGARQTSGNIAFKGMHGAIQVRDGAVSELYLGSGFEVARGVHGVKAVSTTAATAASLRTAGNDWFCAALAPVTVTLPRPGARLPRVTLHNGATQTFPAGLVAGSTSDGATYSFTVPAGNYTIQSDFTLPNVPGYQVTDVGALSTPTLAGVSGEVYTVSASGADIGGSADAFGFVHQTLADEITLIARIASLDNSNPAAKAGLMIRSGTAANAVYAGVFVTPSSGVLFQRRTSAGGTTSTTTTAGLQAPVWLKLVRQGSLISSFFSADGIAWTSAGTATLTMPGGLEAGFVVTAKDNTKAAQAVIDNVSISGSSITMPPPAPADFTATATSSSQIALAWSAASTATTYSVKRATVSGGPYTVIGTNLTTTTYLDTRLSTGSTYYYKVSALNFVGEGADSSEVGATLFPEPDSAIYPVEDPSHASYGGGSTLDSNNIGFNGTGFINFPVTGGFLQFVNVGGGGGGNALLSIRYALPTGTRTGLLIVNGVSQAITFDFTGSWTTWQTKTVNVTLTGGATNTIRFESNGQDLANIDEIRVAPTPSAPASLAATGGSGQIELAWTPVAGASAYLVKRSDTSGSGFTTIATPAAATFTDIGLGDAVTCYYVVCAVNASGTGPATTEAPATTYTSVENWRLAHFGVVGDTGTAAPTADPDGDGWLNAQEFIAGTDPGDPASLLKVSEMAPSGEDMLVSFPSVGGITYRLECSATMESGSWTIVEDDITGTGEIIQITDPGGAAQPQRFYRIVVP
ncbi:fibronectin type III domain-containing protein [Luteolibacter arcticus]|uniref:Fibronectin type III domain-containing protein n=1 Tax=Luteolibacter arcticus TaxID=1581411 RepID=A0ABT3GQD0_9BACT|nr:fibronectin type III domain-containing protein [Luteolibacter arcticus]MCW1925718.1 fibronectin type III domain-containing protein [Luteolibacter arcticus]